MTSTTWILILVVAAVVLAGIWLAWRWRRSKTMQEQFGPEYEHVLEEKGSRRQAERELQQRQERVEQLEIRSLSPEERERYLEEWEAVQADFVDEPHVAIADAHALITEAMSARGYPVGDVEHQEADLSVKHADVLDHYREARRIAERSKRGSASTEDLRQAMVHYRALYGALLEEKEERGEQRDRRHRVA